MKKLAATVATGILIAGVTVSNVSAAEVEVHKGDTLWGISRQHNMTVEELMDINNIKSTTIHPDQILVISETEQYTVKKGDTLSGIGNELGVTVQSLKEANGLKSDLITIGQGLKVKDGNTEQVADPVEEAPEENVEISETDAEAAAQAEAEAEQAKADEEAAAQAETEQAKAEEEAAAQAEAEQAKADEEAAAQAEAEQAKADEEAAAQAESEQAKADKEKAETKKETTQVNTETKQTTTTTTEATPAKQETKSEKQAEGKTISVSATAYTAKCDGCSGVTATGVDLNNNLNAKVIAVDPSVIPLGSKVYVEGYGYATAADTGGAIQGNKIDVHVPNKNQAYGWGV